MGALDKSITHDTLIRMSKERLPVAHLLALGGLIVGLERNSSPVDFERSRQKLLVLYRRLAKRYRGSEPALARKMERIAQAERPDRIIRRGRISLIKSAGKKSILAWSIAQQVKYARSRKGWRQEDLAGRTGIARPNIARLEAGRYVPKLATLSIVADALALDMKSLVSMPKPLYGADARLGEMGVADWSRQLNNLERKP